MTARSMLSRFVVLLLGMVSHPSIFVLLVLSSLQMVGATCPNCHGSFTSCDYDNTKVCAGMAAVAINLATVAVGNGALTLRGLVKPRFMKMLSQISTEAISVVVKPSGAGYAFRHRCVYERYEDPGGHQHGSNHLRLCCGINHAFN